MAKKFSWIILVPLALFIIDFSVSNRELATLTLWPLPFATEAPLFVIALGGAVLGFLFGAASAWLSGSAARKRSRTEAQRALTAERKTENLRVKLAKLEEEKDALISAGPSPSPGLGQALPAPDKAA